MTARKRTAQLAAWVAIAIFAQWAAAETILRIGMPTTPSRLDPARSEIGQESIVMAGIYDSLYTLDPLARPAAVVPLAAVALPEISADYRTYTIRVRRGIYFTPHPAFKGQRRELTAGDFAYSMRRTLDPKVHSPSQSVLEGKIAGLDALAKRARDSGGALDYGAPVEGLALLDSHTLRIRLNAPDPYFIYNLLGTPIVGVAREVVEAEGDAYAHRPIGTGGYKVESFTSGQRLVLVRNPEFRELRFESLLSPASRPKGASHPMRGRILPGFDRLELFSTPEPTTELLALRQGEVDLIVLFTPQLALKNGRLDDNLRRLGVNVVRDASPMVMAIYFNMRNPVVGGDSLPRVALRRAIAMAFDDAEWIRVIDGGLSTAVTQWVPSGMEGHLAGYTSPNRFDPAAANALLDRMGYARAADGYRRNPDGSTLALPWLIGTTSEGRTRAEFAKRMLDRLGLRVEFEAAPGAERVRRMNQCAFGIVTMDWSTGSPDGTDPMSVFYGKAIGGINSSCYQDAIFDAAYEKALVTLPGPERNAAFRTMQSRIDAFVPARPLPVGDMLILTRRQVLGPFGVPGDWLQIMTLSPRDAPRSQ